MDFDHLLYPELKMLHWLKLSQSFFLCIFCMMILLSSLNGLERCLLSMATDNAFVTIENSSVKRYAACYFTRAQMSMISGNGWKLKAINTKKHFLVTTGTNLFPTG